MGAGPTAPTAPAATDRAPAPRPPHDPERDSLGPADPLLLAGPAARVRQLGDRLQTLPALARLRPLAAPPRPPGRRPRRCVNRSDAVGPLTRPIERFNRPASDPSRGCRSQN